MLRQTHPIENLTDSLIEAFHSVFDVWEQDENGFDPEHGTGGICEVVANALCDVLLENDIECSAGEYGEEHVAVYFFDEEDEAVYVLDIPYQLYEMRQGYCVWSKIEGFVCQPYNLYVEFVDNVRKEDVEKYFEMLF